MNISPQRRRRILEAQKLRQQGCSIRTIAEYLDVSPSTVHADLKLLETNWSDVTGPAAADKLLEHLNQLRARLAVLLEHDPLEIFHKFIISAGDGYYRIWADRLSPSDLVRIHQARASEITPLFREIRRAINDVHRRGLQRWMEYTDPAFEYDDRELADPSFPEPEALHPDQPDDLGDLDHSDNLDEAEPDRTTPNKPEQADDPSAHPEQEILTTLSAEKNSIEHPEHPEFDALELNVPGLDELGLDLLDLDEDPERRLKQLLDLAKEAEQETFRAIQANNHYADAASG